MKLRIKIIISLGPALGNQDTFHGLGILFDTYANKRHRVFFFDFSFFWYQYLYKLEMIEYTFFLVSISICFCNDQ